MKILVGIDGSERGQKALEWAVHFAREGEDSLTLLTVAGFESALPANVDQDALSCAAASVLDKAESLVAERHPGIEARAEVATGNVVEGIIDAASRHDMVVLGSHHSMATGSVTGGATALRVSVSVSVPTVAVPADWSVEAEGEKIMVGVGPDDVSEAAVAFSVKEALRSGRPLRMVSAWGLPSFLSRPAEVMGGGLGPVGVQFQNALDARIEALRAAHPGLRVEGTAVEGPSPARVLADESRGCSMLVMGTHSRVALGRVLFGSVTHGVLMSLKVPTVIVPQA